MSELILAGEPIVRLTCFFGILLLIALWESVAPRRKRAHPRRARWPANLGVAALNTALLRAIAPAAAVGFALLAEDRRWGLLNQLSLPPILSIVLSIVALDLVIYLQHVMFHAVPALWRLHRMHHADLDVDVTTGTRFHPLEILISMGIKLAAIAALGSPAVAVLVFEVLLNATSMFNHGNVRIPGRLDHGLRWLVVTPDMHRVHHSVLVAETNSNFGFNLPWWDRLLGTYKAQPEQGHEAMTLGIEQFRAPDDLRLSRMLLQPFRRGIGHYPINRRSRNA